MVYGCTQERASIDGESSGNIFATDLDVIAGDLYTIALTQPRITCCRYSIDENLYGNGLKRIRISLIIWAYFCCIKLPNNQLHDSHRQSPISATMPFPKITISTINPNIVNSQHSLSCINMNDVIIK
jgi:hypothetical protein